MTQPERDNIIERYIDGRMSPAERREFIDLLDRDEAMRGMLHAETLINNAIRSDRMAAPGPSAASRAQFLTMLASLPAPNAPLPGADAGSSRNGRSSGGGIAGNVLTKTIVTTVVGVAVTIGAVILLPRPSPTRPPAPTPAVIEAPSQRVTEPTPRPQANAPEYSAPNIPVQTMGQQPTEAGSTRDRISPSKWREGARAAAARTVVERKDEAGSRSPTSQRAEKPGEEGKMITEPAKTRANVRDPVIN